MQETTIFNLKNESRPKIEVDNFEYYMGIENYRCLYLRSRKFKVKNLCLTKLIKGGKSFSAMEWNTATLKNFNYLKFDILFFDTLFQQQFDVH